MAFVDVAGDEPLATGLDRRAALAQFHVREAQGGLVSGAAAFARLWAHLPAFRFLALALRLPGALWLAERAYRAFLPLRPRIAALLPASACRDAACRRP